MIHLGSFTDTVVQSAKKYVKPFVYNPVILAITIVMLILVIYSAAMETEKPKIRFAFWSGLILIPLIFIHDKLIIDEVKQESENKIANVISSPSDGLIGRGELAPSVSGAGKSQMPRRAPPPVPSATSVRPGRGPEFNSSMIGTLGAGVRGSAYGGTSGGLGGLSASTILNTPSGTGSSGGLGGLGGGLGGLGGGLGGLGGGNGRLGYAGGIPLGNQY